MLFVVLVSLFYLVSPTYGAVPSIEWQLDDGRVLMAQSGELGTTGVTVQVRQTPLVHGTRFDVRLRNRTGTDYNHTALRVRLPRTGSATQAVIEGLLVPVPAEITERWERGSLTGVKYGFSYEIKSGGTTLSKVGPATTEGQWGGRAKGIVRVDGKAYVVPEFWERQPRRVTVTANEVIIGLFEGSEKARYGAESSEPLRAGEDVWDRFAIIDDDALDDADVLMEAEGLPLLSPSQREELMRRFGIAPEGSASLIETNDPDGATLLRKLDQWQGTSWEKRYADDNSARYWAGEEDSTRTTLFSLFERGFYYAVSDPAIYSWREFGDIQWNGGMSDLHYDWLRSALKHYLRTGNEQALRWAVAAMRHAVSVDHVWESPKTAAVTNYTNVAGLARYEKGDHGGNDFVARPTHTWAEGLFLAAAITADPWVRETAIDVAEGTWRYWNGDQAAIWGATYGETREITWPLLVQVVAFRETGDQRYWQKAKELMTQVYEQEQRSGGLGYVTNSSSDVGNVNNAQGLMNAYAVKPMLAFADTAMERNEWSGAYTDLLRRWATWLTTPVPNGAYFPDGSFFAPSSPNVSYGSFAYFFCPPGKTCTQPTSTSGEPAYNTMIADLLAWLAQHDPAGRNPNTNVGWNELSRITLYDTVFHAPHPYGVVGFLTNQYPTTETKALGWMQLFTDRAAMWLSGGSVVPDTTPPSVVIASPKDGTVVDSSPLLVSGTATDDGAVALVRSKVNGGAWKNCSLQPPSFSCSVALVEGPNSIEVEALDGAGNAAGQTVSVTFRKPSSVVCSGENGKDYNVNDFRTVESPISIGCSGAATAVKVRVDIVHPRMADLLISVVHPDGTNATIWNYRSGKDLHQTFTLPALAGKSSGGTWRLRIYDRAFLKTGRLDYWRLDVEAR